MFALATCEPPEKRPTYEFFGIFTLYWSHTADLESGTSGHSCDLHRYHCILMFILLMLTLGHCELVSPFARFLSC